MSRIPRILVALILAASGCSDSPAPSTPEGPPDVPDALFYEPPEVCLTGTETGDTLFVESLGDGDLVWTPVQVPAGSAGLSDPHTVTPDVTLGLLWSWDPPGPYPVRDSLVVTTNDPRHPRVVIPFYRADPAGETDVTPPPPPLLATPADGDTFSVGESILVRWSALDDCSGIRHYKIEVSDSPGFANILCCRANLTQPFAVLEVEPGDEGTAWWRVYAVDEAGLRSVSSETRTWVVR